MALNRYSPDEKRDAMAAYAFCSGNQQKTEKLLSDAGLTVSFHTIVGWVRREKDLYEQVKAEIDGHTRSMMADSHKRLANMYMEGEEIGLAQLIKDLESGELTGKDLARALKDMSVGSAVHTDKGELLSGQPTARVATDANDIKRELASLGIHVIESDAVEEPEPKELPVETS